MKDMLSSMIGYILKSYGVIPWRKVCHNFIIPYMTKVNDVSSLDLIYFMIIKPSTDYLILILDLCQSLESFTTKYSAGRIGL